MRSIQAVFLFALASLAILHYRAQAQSVAEPNSGETVLHTTTNLVLVDVVVTDKGKAVHGLDRNRFHVFEDGHEQPIASFDEHQPAAVRNDAYTPPTILASLPRHTYSNVPAYPEGSAANVLLLDELNTPQENREFLRQQMLEYLGAVPPGTSLAVFTLTSELRMVQGFTGDGSQATKALESMKHVDFGGHLSDQKPSVDIPDFYVHVGPPVYDPLTDGRPQMTVLAVQQLARYLKLIPGRKNLIWFAGTFPVAFDPGAALSAAQVAVYPVDARGIMSVRGTLVSDRYGEYGGGMEGDEYSKDQIKAEHAAMEQFAEQTGGEAYFNTNGLKEAVAVAVKNGSSYYTIGYVPAAKKLDGKFRAIKVHLNNGGYELAYRRGYYAVPPDQPSTRDDPLQPSQLTASVVHGAPAATHILFQARVLPATDPLLHEMNVPAGPAGEMAADLKAPLQHTIVDLTLDPQGLAFNETPEGTHRARIEFTLAAYDTGGRRENYLVRGIQLNIKPDQFARIMVEGVPIRLALDLPMGPSSLRVAVYDLDAGRVGSLEVPVTVTAGEH
jgi:VWFA-related protein